MPALTIGIVLYKNSQYLEQSISSLLNQSFQDFELILKDNDPDLEATKIIKNKFLDSRIKFLVGTNNYHSGGHNEIVNSANSPLYLCASYDMFYPKDFLHLLLEKSEKYSNKVLAPLLLRWDFQDQKQTDIIDSAGLLAKPSHHFSDRAQGQKWHHQFPESRVFGASGACFLIPTDLYREVGGFDENLFYKNDIDFAYRLNWLGYETIFTPDAFAYHDRQVSTQKSKSNSEKQNSELGQQILIAKNFSPDYSFSFKFQTKFYMLIRKLFYPSTKLPANLKPSPKKISAQAMQKLFN